MRLISKRPGIWTNNPTLLWWYRNLSRADYRIQGWRKHAIFPDFIDSHTSVADRTDFDKVFVVESKDIHLKNEDTDYKNRFSSCATGSQEKRAGRSWAWNFQRGKLFFELVFGDECQKKLNAMLAY